MNGSSLRPDERDTRASEGAGETEPEPVSPGSAGEVWMLIGLVVLVVLLGVLGSAVILPALR